VWKLTVMTPISSPTGWRVSCIAFIPAARRICCSRSAKAYIKDKQLLIIPMMNDNKLVAYKVK
jgi:hypothetical protein